MLTYDNARVYNVGGRRIVVTVMVGAVAATASALRGRRFR
jgi:hypothetical protein